MWSEMRFELYWKMVRDLYIPILERQKQVWQRAHQDGNITAIAEQIEARLNILTYEDAKNLLKTCKDTENPGYISPLKSLFTELKQVIITVTKQTNNLPVDYREYVTKLTSPRTNAMNAHSRWTELKLSSSGSDSDKQASDERPDPPPIIEEATLDFLPRSRSIINEPPTASDLKTDNITSSVIPPRL